MKHFLIFSMTGIAALCLSLPLAAQTAAAAKPAATSNLPPVHPPPKDAIAPPQPGVLGKPGYKAPRLPDGHPDLQGVWNNATLTPLQRPKKGPGAGHEFFTKEEFDQYTKEELDRVNGDKLSGVGNYNEFWRDRGHLSPDMRTSMIFDPPDGMIPALTPENQKRIAAKAAAARGHEYDGPEMVNPQLRCLEVNNAGPPMEPTNYNANYQIVQAPGMFTLLSEQIHDVFVVPTDGRPHVPSAIRMVNGDSIGHWEGDTLVVDTTNFTDMTPFHGSDENLHLIQKYTRVASNMLKYEFTIDDPSAFVKPWSARYPMFLTNEVIYEYACQEGNYGLYDSISGTRYEELHPPPPGAGGAGKKKKKGE